MEEESIINDKKRIKFKTEIINNNIEYNDNINKQLNDLSNALYIIEQYGAAPILPDGKIGGNGCILIDNKLYISKSGKKAGYKLNRNDFCFIKYFNNNEWKCLYSNYLNDYNIKPSSDTPLLWMSIINAYKLYNWNKQPKIALHGHALCDEYTANLLNLPISKNETLFSTPDDVNALELLFKEYSYPDNKIFIRKNHGFFILAQDINEALNIFHSKIVPHLNKENTIK